MNEAKKTWQQRYRNGRGRGLFWGLALVALGGFWFVSNLNLVPEPAKVVIPALVILWGVATIFTRREPR